MLSVMNKNKPIFTAVEILLLFLALFFTALTLRVIVTQSVPKTQIGTVIKMLVLGVWLMISFFQFRPMRRTQVFIAWTVIAVIHLAMFIAFYDNYYLSYLDKYNQQRNYSRFLITPIILLIFFQLCRQLSLFFYRQEVGQVSVHFNNIIGENRVANGVERICAAGMFVIPILSYYFCYYS